MKTCTAFAAAAVVAMLSLDSAVAMKSYLKKFPNGDGAFTQALGHVSDSDTGLNDLGKLYSSKGGDWAAMCKEKFPGADMTLGEAFGDPCCKWTSGAADFKVEPFVKPSKKTECAANKPSAAPAPAPGADKPAVTPAPAGKPSPVPSPVPSSPSAGKPDTGKPDAGKPDAGKPDAGKPDAGKPDAGKPDAGKPGAGKPDAGKPDAGKPGAGKPDAGKPGKPSKCGVKKEAKSLEDSEDDDY